jgi:predicted kinase
MKDELFGRAISDAQLSKTDWAQIYARTDEQIARYLRAERNVVDASRNFRRDERRVARGIANASRADVVTIFVDTPEDVVRRRLSENRISPARHEVSDEEFEKLLAGMEPPTADENALVLRHGDDLSQWITENLTAVL